MENRTDRQGMPFTYSLRALYKNNTPITKLKSQSKYDKNI
jgi:hypothetical protein